MPTIRLVPRTYYSSSTTYLSVSNEQNMYNNTDNTTYATVTNTQTGTTSYYIYLRDFNFDDIPSNATINSFSIKLKARESGINTNSNYAPKLCNNTSQITSTFSAIGTTATVLTASGYNVNFETIKNYGSNFGIRVNCRRANRNTTGYMYIYGAEIEVNYTVPVSYTITSTLNGDGTLEPLGAYSAYEGDIYNLTIIPSNNTSAVTATQDGVDITSRIVVHQSSQYTKNTNLGTYTLISGSFNGSGGTYFAGIVGNGETHQQQPLTIIQAEAVQSLCLIMICQYKTYQETQLLQTHIAGLTVMPNQHQTTTNICVFNYIPMTQHSQVN